ncbi:MAG: DUF5752 family protein [candidate division Zixibacteria bacterium]|nr:DUF5752 family protein [candidate division Zixibacteria bacterium]
MAKAKRVAPFKFYTSVPLVELTGQKAKNLKELKTIIEEIDGSSIYFHTHHYVREHHFLSQEYPSDFAYWVAEVLQEKVLGEKLAILDLRNFPTIRSLREKIVELILDYLDKTSSTRDVQPGMEFHFRRTISVVITTPYQADSLAEFRRCLEKVDLYSLYFHLMESRLRVTGETNDFSRWIRENFDKESLAQAIEDLDPYFYPLEQTKDRLLKILARESYRERVKQKLSSYTTNSGIGEFLQGKKPFNRFKSSFHRLMGGE